MLILTQLKRAPWDISVFYQDDSGSIRERHHLREWKETDFVQESALVGTNIAAVHSSDASRTVIFFQDVDGFVCSR